MSSNPLDIRSVWKSLVASCVCVCGCKFEHAFSMLSSPALRCSSPAQNAFVFIAECVRLQHNTRVRLLFGSWFRNPPPPPKKNRNYGEKDFC